MTPSMGDSLLFGLKKDAAIHSQLDPWELPPCFLQRKNEWKSLQTHSGYWKEKEEEFTAIRSAGESSSAAASPSYVGLRKTLEFYRNDSSKTDWIIHEYHHLRKDDHGGALFLQEDVVLRKVFQKCNNKTDQDSSLYYDVESCAKAYKELNHVRPALAGLLKPILDDLQNKATSLPASEEISELTPRKKLSDSMEAPSTVISELPRRNKKLSESIQSLKAVIIEASELLDEVSGGLNKDLGGVHCDTRGRSSNVWQHFTKISSTKDPAEVYAACHRCDKVLKAHPKKHGTSHLKRHIHTCSSRNQPNPSTDEDREMLHRLRAVLLNNPSEQQKMDCQEDLTQLDPWDPKLTRSNPWYWYVTSSLNRQTKGGHWKEIEFTAIRTNQLQGCWEDIDMEIAVIQMAHELQVQAQAPKPRYMGLRRTLQFHHQDGRKTDWIMFEYQQLDESPALFLQGDMVIRKVFLYDKDVETCGISKTDKWLNTNGHGDDEEYFNGVGVSTDITTSSSDCDCVDSGVDRKRKRTVASRHGSEVWMHYTKIYNTDHALVYVVCHSCDRGYSSGHSKNGTSHLWRHNRSCINKRPRTENANDSTNECEAEIWPLFLALTNHGETGHHGYAESWSQEDGPAY